MRTVKNAMNKTIQIHLQKIGTMALKKANIENVNEYNRLNSERRK